MTSLLIYGLCLLASTLSALLLARAYLRSGERLLLYSTICFAMLALNNLLLVVDVLLPETPLAVFRNLATLGGITVLLYAFIWEID
jgi:hypothetical protein